MKTQKAKAANQLLKSPYRTTSLSGVMPFLDISSSNCFLLIMSRVGSRLMSRLHQMRVAPSMWPLR